MQATEHRKTAGNRYAQLLHGEQERLLSITAQIGGASTDKRANQIAMLITARVIHRLQRSAFVLDVADLA